MKLLNLAIVGLGVFALTSCGGVSDRHEEISELNKQAKWDEDQTNQAIDIYIEGQKEWAELYEDIENIEAKLDLEDNIERYGDKDVKKERKEEIKEAEKNLKEVMKEIEKEYKVKEPKESDSYDDYSAEEDVYSEEADY